MRRLIAGCFGWLGRHAAPLIAASVFVGLLLPPLTASLRPFLLGFITLSIIIALMRVDWGVLGVRARRPGVAVWSCVWMLLLSPVATWAVLAFGPLPAGIVAGVVLMAAAPPITSAAAFGLILGLDAALMVVAVVFAMVATPFTLPPMALWLLGLEIDIGVGEFMARLAALIAVIFLLAYLARRLAGRAWLERNALRLDGASVLALAGFAIAIMDGVTDVVVARPGYAITCVVVAFAANLGLQAAAVLLFARQGRLAALSVGLMSGNRNMGLVLAVLADRADFDVVVFFALAQIPMYTLPALLLPAYRRLLRA